MSWAKLLAFSLQPICLPSFPSQSMAVMSFLLLKCVSWSKQLCLLSHTSHNVGKSWWCYFPLSTACHTMLPHCYYSCPSLHQPPQDYYWGLKKASLPPPRLPFSGSQHSDQGSPTTNRSLLSPLQPCRTPHSTSNGHESCVPLPSSLLP